MEKDLKKCSSKKHKEVNAVSYCEHCKLYFCNKCQNLHSDFFEDHNIYKIDKDIPEISLLYCKEKGHSDNLSYYCKNHNKLCCAFCICKIKDEKNGQHSNCDVCIIRDIKTEKKSKLKENIKNLEELSSDINESVEKIKIIYEKMDKEKEELKLKVQKIFTNIRNVINNREDELLLIIDKKYNEKSFEAEIFKEIEKLPNKIKISLEEGKPLSLDNEWDNDNKLSLSIRKCINIENNIKNIYKLKEKINKFNDNINSNIRFYPNDEKEINPFLDNLKFFGKIMDGEILNISKISKILEHNEEYITALNNWINPKDNIQCELLYRLSDHGEKFSKFHELCDNNGPLLILFQINDGTKIGMYTPLILEYKNQLSWKDDMETFIFNLNQSKKYRKIKNAQSLFYDIEHGIYTARFGNGRSCKSMKKLVLYVNDINFYYENGSDILPSKGEKAYFELSEVEVFKMIKYENN